MFTKKTVRSGIAGAGFSARFHYESLCRVHGVDVDLRGVYALDQEQAAAYARERGIHHFAALDALLDEVDLVHCCVLVAGHEEVAVAALNRGKSVIVEKPLTGYLGDGTDAFHGDTFPKQDALKHGLASVERMLDAERKSAGRIFYAENWVYAPAIQREREVIEKTGAQILWIHGEEAHSGSHNPTYAYWKYSGGGVLIGKGCHPLTAALYLKRVEGRARDGKPIGPKTVSARTAALTRMPTFLDAGFIRRDYYDIDDFSMMHVTFKTARWQPFLPRILFWAASITGSKSPRTTTAPCATSTRTPPCRCTTRATKFSPTSIPWKKLNRNRVGRIYRPTRTGSPGTRRKSRPSTAASPMGTPWKVTAFLERTPFPPYMPPMCPLKTEAKKCR